MELLERKYNSWKLFGGKRRDAELERLAEAEDDFNFRRLFIEENEKWLHVFYSRKRVSQLIAISLLLFGLVTFQFATLSLVVSIIAFIFLIISVFFGWKMKTTASKYQFGLKMVDIVIADTYGFSL